MEDKNPVTHVCDLKFKKMIVFITSFTNHISNHTSQTNAITGCMLTPIQAGRSVIQAYVIIRIFARFYYSRIKPFYDTILPNFNKNA